MNLKNAITIDFETEPIRPRPNYPPKPVSVAIKYGAGPAVFYAWGHPTGNNCTKAAAAKALKAAWKSGLPLLFHNAGFDLDVAKTHFGLELPAWQRIHDTLPMLFLRDPYAKSFSLKPASEDILKMKPEERDAIIDWLMEHQPVEGVKLSRSKKSENYAGAYICMASAELVGPYCIGDVDRTYKLAIKVGKELKRRKMLGAYDRERRLIPVILAMEEHGVRVDVKALDADAKLYEATVARIDKWLRRKLKVKDLNIDSNDDLVAALIKAGFVDETLLGLTPTGKVSTDKKSLEAGVTDPQMAAVLRYRGAVTTCLRTFIKPWLEIARVGGRIYTRWNTTRSDYHGGVAGARTGRLSCTPNFMNIPKAFEALFSAHEPDLKRRKTLPKSPIKGLPQPPQVRRYILPDEGHILIDRDFSSQEPRVLAHFEDGRLAEAYNKNPEMDMHQHVADTMQVDRYRGKQLNLSIIYGIGQGLLAEKLGCSVDEARARKAEYFREFPSIKGLIQDITDKAKSGKAIRTWGGREYHVEPPKVVNGRLRDFYYKLLNYLVQGSSADLTKQTMIEFAEESGPDVRVLVSVHDELLVSCKKTTWEKTMCVLKEIMARDLLDVPMRSTGQVGKTWATMEKCE